MGFLQQPFVKVASLGELVKFEHTIFALPFTLSACLLASETHWPNLFTLFWVLGAMVGGRTYAMALNRIADRAIDAQNPRTQSRPLTTGRISLTEAWGLMLIALSLMILCVWQLPLLCRQLLPVALMVLTLYSFVKRFSVLCHWVLGLALGSATMGGWLAVSGAWQNAALWLGSAVLFWVAGFDIIYACLDYDFDKNQGLHSVPSWLGLSNALWVSRLCHVISIGCFIGLLYALPSTYVTPWLWASVLLIAGLLIYEQSLVSASDLSHVNEAFFTTNGVVSIGFLIGIVLNHALVNLS